MQNHTGPDVPNGEVAARQAMMKVLSLAARADIEAAFATLGPLPEFVPMRKPEIGLLMLRAQAGGQGAPFNLGEVTVSRAVTECATGHIGYSFLLGRDTAKAQTAAKIDALWQNPAFRDRVEAMILAPLRAKQEAADQLAARQTEATKVDFFTLVRGED